MNVVLSNQISELEKYLAFRGKTVHPRIKWVSVNILLPIAQHYQQLQQELNSNVKDSLRLCKYFLMMMRNMQ